MLKTDSFADFLNEATSEAASDGVIIENPNADGQLHRCPTIDHQNKNNGAYIIHHNGDFYVLWYMAWDNGAENTICGKPESEWNTREKQEYKKLLKEIKAKRQAELEKGYAEAAKSAKIEWDSATKADDNHPYLKLKHIPAIGLRKDNKGNLLVKILGPDGEIQSLQRLLPEKLASGTNKLYFPGGKIAGGYAVIPAKDGNKGLPLLICEGYATAVSLHLSTGYVVLIALQANNLETIGKFARKKHPKRQICLCADYDVHTEKMLEKYPEPGGIGTAKARKAAEAIEAHLAICPSIVEGEKADFNDLFCLKDGKKRVAEVIEKALNSNPEKSKPIIKYVPGDTIKNISELEIALQDNVYQNGGRLVNIIRLPQDKILGKIEFKSGIAVINPLDTDSLCVLASRYANWIKYDSKKDIDIPCDPPTKIIKLLIGNKGFWTFNPLFGLITCPIIRTNGSIINKPGYDSETGLYADFDSKLFPQIPEKPTKKDAEKALTILKEAISEFPFKTNIDRAVALSAMLTAVARPSLPTAPLHAFSAPCPGTGKTTCANVPAIMATGKEAPVFNYVSDPDEMRKAFFSLLSCGSQIILIDNAVGIINNPLLNTTISQGEITDRILGQNDKKLTVSTKALFMITGNNLIFADDMIRRTLICTLDRNEERPAEYDFTRKDFTGWLINNRHKLVMAALTILRAYHIAGNPNKLKPLNTYGDWSDLVRSGLVWLGEDDPVKSQRTIESNDPEREILENVLTAWWNYYQDTPKQVKELLDNKPDIHINDNGIEKYIISDEKLELSQAISAISRKPGGISAQTLGLWLRKKSGNIANGFRLLKAGDNQNTALWKVVKWG